MEPVRIHIPKELFEPAATSHYAGEEEWERLELGADVYGFDAPVRWQADITNTGGALLVRGTAEAQVRCACARCLEDARFAVCGDIEGYFLIKPEDGAPDDLEDDEFDVLDADDAIDMAPLIQAALILEMPVVPLCSDDCRGLCPTCGANLNDGACSCESAADAPARPDNPFAVLKGMKFD